MRSALSQASRLLVLAVMMLAGCGGQPAAEPRASVVEVLSETDATEGFARALQPRAFAFPRDDGPHPEFQTEWWYWTGNLRAADGRRFGYQLTFFRRALAARVPKREASLAARDVWFAHFTLTDVEGRRFHFFERWSRGAAGLAGGRAQPFRVWLEAWSASGVPGGVRLQAAQGDVAVDLVLRSRKPEALQGDRGLSRKSAEPGNASYYYSRTRLATSGTVTLAGTAVKVAGSSWLDREWSTSALPPAIAGWDWLSLQLADGRDLMLYQLRRKAGGADQWSSGSLVARDGTVAPLQARDFTIEPLARWRSPHSGATYPSGWRVRVPSHGLDLVVKPRLQDQELRLSFTYWEGAVAVEGGGEGYVELTGYAER